MEWLHQLINWIINTVGMPGIWAVVFAESGLFFGFFLPGDTLLFTAGLFAGAGRFNITVLTIGIVIAAIAGDQVGYITGKKFGPKIFKQNHKLFNQQHLLSAKKFFDKHGPVALILARFTPAVRTFTPIVAGAVNMEYKKFVTFNVIGGILWGTGMTLLGYFLGNIIGEENMKKYDILIIFTILILSIIPIITEYLAHKKSQKQESLNVDTNTPFSKNDV